MLLLFSSVKREEKKKKKRNHNRQYIPPFRLYDDRLSISSDCEGKAGQNTVHL